MVVGTASGKIAALNEKDGKTLWEYDSQGGQLKLAVNNNKLFAGTEDGRGLILELQTGKPISEHRAEYFLNTFTQDRIYFVSEDKLYELE